MSCPECGGKLKSVIEGSSVTTYCAACDWSVTTSYIDPMFEDETEYTLHLVQGNTVCRETISSVSKAWNCNYLVAKSLIEDPSGGDIKGDAMMISKVVSILKNGNVAYIIQPEWPYS